MIKKENLIKTLKSLEVVLRQPVNLKNAGASDLYVDIKKAYGYPDVSNSIVDALWAIIDKTATCVVASGFGGMPIATGLSLKYNLKLTLVREEPKKYGRSNWIDGYVPNKNDKVFIVDDVFTTGGSLRKTIEVIKPTRAKILGCYVVVKRGEGSLDVPLTSLLNLEDIL